MPETVHVFGLVAAHLAVEQARLGAPGAFGAAGRERPPFVEAVRPEEAAQGGVTGASSGCFSASARRLS